MKELEERVKKIDLIDYEEGEQEERVDDNGERENGNLDDEDIRSVLRHRTPPLPQVACTHSFSLSVCLSVFFIVLFFAFIFNNFWGGGLFCFCFC